jgi:hypothetical protein
MQRPFSIKICLLTLAFFLASLIAASFHVHEHRAELQSQHDCAACAVMHNGKQMSATSLVNFAPTLFAAVATLSASVHSHTICFQQIYPTRAPPIASL